MTQIETHLQTIHDELLSALAKHPEPFNSPHEGYAVIKEEIDELWGAIKCDDLPHARTEAAQAAALLVRFLLELDIEPRREHEETGE
jgi:hypothetical protein